MSRRDPELEARLRTLEAALFDASPDVQLLCDTDGRIIARNKAARGLGDAELLAELFDEPGEIAALRRRNFLGADQLVLRLTDGRQAMIAAAPVSLDGQRHWEVVLHDVTTHALLGEDQQVARQLAAVGRLGRLVSNEITSPLAVLLGRIELLQTLGSPPPELLQRHLAVMGDHARRIATVIQDLDALAVQGGGGLAPIGLEELLEGVLREQAERLSGMSISVDVTPPELATSGQAHRLHQVVGTLLAELASSLGQGARLRIEAVPRETEVAVIMTGMASPRFPEVRRRILDSWSAESTHRDLGAAVAVSILVAHSGRLQAALGGSGLELVLPRRQAVAAPSEGLRVLFVDDDATVVGTTLNMLTSLGHEAVGVHSAEEALVTLETQPFDAVVTDLVLPGLSGLGLREVISTRWPGLECRTVIVSGARQAPPEGVRFVPKPYTRAHLHEALEGALLDDCSASEESVS